MNATVILFSILVLSVMFSPVAVSATHMEDKIREMMEKQSRKPETIQNAKDYWCLNSYLNMMAGSALEQRYGAQYISEKDLLDTTDLIIDKYSDDSNFLLFPDDKYSYSPIPYSDEPSLYLTFNNNTNIIYVDVSGHNPLKISKAQELLTDFNNVILERFVIMEHVEHDVFSEVSCGITEDDLGIKKPADPSSNIMYKQYINFREEIVTVKTIHVDELLDRGYLLYEAWYDFKLP